MTEKVSGKRNTQSAGIPLAEADTQYREISLKAETLRLRMSEELSLLLKDSGVSLAFPLESRIKTWQSVEEKLERISISHLLELHDLVGLRIVLQFQRDISKVANLINEHFVVVSSRDIAEKLNEDQFGYT